MVSLKDTAVIWRFLDGKAGHQSQTEGLVVSLKKLHPGCIVFDIAIPELRKLFAILVNWQNFSQQDLLLPDILIGAGHQTHLWLLLAKITTGGKNIVLMKPSLPYLCFDLCLIPEHDEPGIDEKIVTTKGALNAIEPSKDKNKDLVLILLGGPSKRHGWDEDQTLTEIKTIISKNKHKHLIITDSPRTPVATSHKLKQLKDSHVRYISFSHTERTWLVEQLQNCSERWVSEDSISMIYEALTAGGNAFVLSTPRTRQDKIISSLDKLYEKRYLLSFDAWKNNIQPSALVLNESMRCAEIIQKKFLHKPYPRK